MSGKKYNHILEGHNGCYFICEQEGEPNKLLLFIHYQVAEINQDELDFLLESVNKWNGHDFGLEINKDEAHIIEFYPRCPTGMFDAYKILIAHAIVYTIRHNFNHLFEYTGII